MYAYKGIWEEFPAIDDIFHQIGSRWNIRVTSGGAYQLKSLKNDTLISEQAMILAGYDGVVITLDGEEFLLIPFFDYYYLVKTDEIEYEKIDFNF